MFAQGASDSRAVSPFSVSIRCASRTAAPGVPAPLSQYHDGAREAGSAQKPRFKRQPGLLNERLKVLFVEGLPESPRGVQAEAHPNHAGETPDCKPAIAPQPISHVASNGRSHECEEVLHRLTSPWRHDLTLVQVPHRCYPEWTQRGMRDQSEKPIRGRQEGVTGHAAELGSSDGETRWLSLAPRRPASAYGLERAPRPVHCLCRRRAHTVNRSGNCFARSTGLPALN